MERKKVGILTFHRAYNHGAMLQCYALYKTIEKLGHNPEIIDYRQPYIEEQYEYANSNKIITKKEVGKVISHPRWIPGFIIKTLPQRIRYIKKRWCLYKELSFSKKITSPNNIPQELDTIIIGSDQIWANYCTNGIDETYYGNFPHENTKVIGYAISSNIASLKETGSKKLSKLCENFDALSFREEDIRNFLSKTINLKSSLVLDPTLLLTQKEWDSLIGKTEETINKEYVLTFFLNHEFNLDDVNEKIKEFAKRRNYEIVDLLSVANSPINFINWIKNAKHIITSSFHTIVFSIIFNKDFYAIKTNNGKDIRYINLINKLGLQERLIDYYELNTVEDMWIKYPNVEKILESERKDSINYLIKNI